MEVPVPEALRDPYGFRRRGTRGIVIPDRQVLICGGNEQIAVHHRLDAALLDESSAAGKPARCLCQLALSNRPEADPEGVERRLNGIAAAQVKRMSTSFLDPRSCVPWPMWKPILASRRPASRL